MGVLLRAILTALAISLPIVVLQSSECLAQSPDVLNHIENIKRVHESQLKSQNRSGQLERRIGDQGILDRKAKLKQSDSKLLVEFHYEKSAGVSGGGMFVSADRLFFQLTDIGDPPWALVTTSRDSKVDRGKLRDFLSLMEPWSDQFYLGGDSIQSILSGSSSVVTCEGSEEHSDGTFRIHWKWPGKVSLSGVLALDIANHYRPVWNEYVPQPSNSKYRVEYAYDAIEETKMTRTVAFTSLGNKYIESVDTLQWDAFPLVDEKEFSLEYYGLSEAAGLPKPN